MGKKDGNQLNKNQVGGVNTPKDEYPTNLYTVDFDYGKLDDSKMLSRTSSILQTTLLHNSPGDP